MQNHSNQPLKKSFALNFKKEKMPMTTDARGSDTTSQYKQQPPQLLLLMLLFNVDLVSIRDDDNISQLALYATHMDNWSD